MRASGERWEDPERTRQKVARRPARAPHHLIENNRLMLNRSAAPQRILTPEIGC